MSNIKQLNGLKVNAIAVEEKRKFDSFSIGLSIPDVLYGHFENIECTVYWICDLPEGDWTILGRAGELTMGVVSNKLGLPQWMNCVESNNLTNELILIKNEL